jgi:PLP dependent protein
VAELIRDIDPELVRRRLGEVRERAGDEVELLVATKYVALEDMGALREAGVELVGENRLQDLEGKQERWGQDFTWDFIGSLQSRKVRSIVSRVRLIHSVSSDSVLEQLGRHAPPDARVLVQVNVSGEPSKGGSPRPARRPPRAPTSRAWPSWRRSMG